ncbi:hypothetical protein J6590_038564 [Homalodisca vitripennis]|nr:hypothetical protein J6590_038564 [Homalodisca vitripennis]
MDARHKGAPNAQANQSSLQQASNYSDITICDGGARARWWGDTASYIAEITARAAYRCRSVATPVPVLFYTSTMKVLMRADTHQDIQVTVITEAKAHFTFSQVLKVASTLFYTNIVLKYCK